jgi:hypothetical protein
MAALKNCIRYSEQHGAGPPLLGLRGELTSIRTLHASSSPLQRSSLARIHVIIANVATIAVVNKSAALTRSAIEDEPNASGHLPQIWSGRK